MTEQVFTILAEGGSLSIERERDQNGERFIYHHSEFGPEDEGMDINKNAEYEKFEQPFQIINSKYPWFKLHLETAHEDYRSYIIDELIKVLTYKGLKPEDLKYSQKNLEKVLNIKLEFGNIPIKNGIQNITIKNFNGSNSTYEYSDMSGDYYGTSVRQDDLKLYKKDNFIDWEIIKCKGTLHFSGSTVIIKDEDDQPTHIFNSEKAFVTTTPVLSQTKGWFFKNI